MIGAHLDSWHTGTGATDNAAGSAVMIETMRILKALNLKLDRTVRIALWTGEEQGLLGSKAYVKEHFGDPETMKLAAAHAKLTGYFNLDYGTVTHHSNMDTADHAQEADLMQAAAVIATVVYQAANRQEMLPRKALP